MDRRAYWLGYAVLFCLEVATVLGNEYFDYDSDRANRHAGPFNGGSRVLVEGQLSFGEVRGGIAAALMLTGLAGLTLVFTAPAGASTAIGVLLAVFIVLALGYTVPPLKLCYRSLGELDVALTQSGSGPSVASTG